MTLNKYFKKKDCLPDPRGSPSLDITPQVIASVNQEVDKKEWKISAASYTFTYMFFLQQASVMLLAVK